MAEPSSFCILFLQLPWLVWTDVFSPLSSAQLFGLGREYRVGGSKEIACMAQDEEEERALADVVDTIKRTSSRKRKMTEGGINWQKELQEKQGTKEEKG